MAYIKRTVLYGDYKDVDLYHTRRAYPDGYTPRRKKTRETTPAQEEVNRKNSIRRLKWLIGANFSGGDLHVVLKYIRKTGIEHRTEEEMRKDIAKFHRAMRAEYKKRGIEYKYIHVMEIGEKGARHHHLLIPHIDSEVIRKNWHFARPTFTSLDDEPYDKLANYFVKQSDNRFRDKRLMKQRYNCSHNLTKPIISKQKITRSSTFRQKVQVPKGWYLIEDSIRTGADADGHIFFKYTMKRIE